MSECEACGLTAGDLPDDIGHDPELIFKDGLCEGCRLEERPEDDPAPVATCDGRDCGGYPHE